MTVCQLRPGPTPGLPILRKHSEPENPGLDRFSPSPSMASLLKPCLQLKTEEAPEPARPTPLQQGLEVAAVSGITAAVGCALGFAPGEVAAFGIITSALLPFTPHVEFLVPRPRDDTYSHDRDSWVTPLLAVAAGASVSMASHLMGLPAVVSSVTGSQASGLVSHFLEVNRPIGKKS